jgi:hypothetical protein
VSTDHGTLAEQLADSGICPALTVKYYRCGRKYPYATVKSAMAATLRRQRLSGVRLFVYRCDHGNHWHLSRIMPEA